MTVPSTAPLAALLASHPEECAAVVAALVTHGREYLTPEEIAVEISVYGRGPHVSRDLIVRIGIALGREHLVKVSVDGIGQIEAVHRHAIALRGAAAWLRSRLSLGPRAPRYADREAIAARIAAVLDCAPSDVYLQWRSSGVVRIAVGGESLDANDIAALVKAGFEPTAEGWDVPGDCGPTTEPAK